MAALLSKGTALPSAESVPTVAPTKGVRGKKAKAEKAPKVKAAAPAAADGVIRFGSASEGDYKEFSSFYKSPFTVDGKEYRSVANYFHSQKFAETDDAFARVRAGFFCSRMSSAKSSSEPTNFWEWK